MKKKYTTPSYKLFELHIQSCILDVSNNCTTKGFPATNPEKSEFVNNETGEGIQWARSNSSNNNSTMWE